MSDKKISQLDAVTDVQDTDAFVLARAGASKQITGASLRADLGGAPSVETVTLTTDASTFMAEHDFDFGAGVLFWFQVTLISTVGDGETFGGGPTDLGADGFALISLTALGSLEEATNSLFRQWDDQDANSQLSTPGQATRYVNFSPSGKVRVHVQVNDASVNIYAGANHPTATVRFDLSAIPL